MDDLPTLSFQTLYHVGTMRAGSKSNMSMEGAGLSVSEHPNVWRIVAGGWISGDLWRLTRSGNAFVDYHALTDEQRHQIVRWGVEQGLYNDIGGTNELWRRTKMVSNPTLAFDFLLTVFIEDTTSLDGVWWEDAFDISSDGSAPRGVIVLSRLAAWHVEKIPEDQAPDIEMVRPQEGAH